jgi:hypothetical protein
MARCILLVLLLFASVASAEPINPYELEKPSDVEYINPYYPTVCDGDSMVKHCKQQGREFTIYTEVTVEDRETAIQFTLDDEMVFSETETQDVPEPGALLLVVGLVAYFVIRK